MKKVINRTIYDQSYYRVQSMIRDPWSIEKISWLKKRFSEIGCPLPSKAFKSQKQYEVWRNKYWNRRNEIINSEDFTSKVEKITNGKKKISSEEYDKLEALREKELPPVFMAILGDILEHFDFNRDDDKFRDFIENYVFFNKRELFRPIMSVKTTRSSKTNKPELFVRIFEYTKKEDIIKNWDFIADTQSRMTGYLGKSKKWEKFDRDNEIYESYKKIKNKCKREKYIPKDREIYLQLHKKYKSLSITQIRNIVSVTEKRLFGLAP